MSLFIYNTLTKQKEEFIPLMAGQVKMYACGVTVYDQCHIGHARSLYLFESFRRYLISQGYKVTFVRNITDIDDKIINKAKELCISAKELAEKSISSYYRDLELLGIEKADIEPKATEHISEIIEMISSLIKKDFAYQASGDVYFRVRKFKDYGKLSGQNLEQMMSGVRIEKDERKEDPLDFALWKKSKESEPYWNSPWGDGRPGWHIECSAMSIKYLGETFDIHGGGMDLVFPHHENEISQSEACTGKKFARYWMHSGLLTINGQKMAKSLGNFISINRFLEEYHPDILKLFFLSSHYSSPSDYNLEKIQEIKKARERIMILLDKINKILQGLTVKELQTFDEIIKLKAQYWAALSDDFNTAKAQGIIFELVNLANKIIDDDSIEKNKKIHNLFVIKDFFKDYQNLFGLSFSKDKELLVSESYILEQIKARDLARKNKDFKSSDYIREDLSKKGIVLEDTKEGTTWRRT